MKSNETTLGEVFIDPDCPKDACVYITDEKGKKIGIIANTGWTIKIKQASKIEKEEDATGNPYLRLRRYTELKCKPGPQIEEETPPPHALEYEGVECTCPDRTQNDIGQCVICKVADIERYLRKVEKQRGK